MSASDKFTLFMRRLGFAKLSDYGLVLTPDDRIQSVRPTVLTDGLGSRIVGWRDGDLAAAELQPWAPPQAVPPSPHVNISPPPPPRRSAQHQTVQPPPVLVAAPAPRVAREPIVEEDDWEWTIALARARAIDPPGAKPRAADPIAEDAWPKTEPLMELSDYQDDKSSIRDIAAVVRRAKMPRVVLPAKATRTTPSPVVAAAGTPRTTVIPVPALATVDARAGQLQPVVRAPHCRPLRGLPGGPIRPIRRSFRRAPRRRLAVASVARATGASDPAAEHHAAARLSAVVLISVCIACGGKSSPAEAPIKTQSKVDSKQAERGAKDTITEITRRSTGESRTVCFRC